jgi:HSP20 family protein
MTVLKSERNAPIVQQARRKPQSLNPPKEFAMLFPTMTGYRRPQLHAFERFLGEVLRAPTQPGVPASADDKAYELSFDMPGVSRDHIKVDIEGSVVRIETLPEAPRSYRGVYELPQEIDPEASTAKFENGVLSLTLAKVQPVSKARSLNIG